MHTFITFVIFFANIISFIFSKWYKRNANSKVIIYELIFDPQIVSQKELCDIILDQTSDVSKPALYLDTNSGGLGHSIISLTNEILISIELKRRFYSNLFPVL